MLNGGVMKLSELETPRLILEKGKLEKNLRSMREHLGRLGVPLRPHGKTAKCIEVVRIALQGQPGGITVSSLKEAEYYFSHGITDLLYAVGIAPVKLDHIADLRKRGADISILLDNMEQAKVAAEYGKKHGETFPVLIELDSDGHRSGLTPADPELIEIGRFLHKEKGVSLRGVLTHAGGSYGVGSVDEIRKAALQERDVAVACSRLLHGAGLPCPVVSVGSTPTATCAEDLTGVTEVRAGVYMFFDLVMAGLGVCCIEDIAVSVLTSVIGYQKNKGWVITDSGWMSLSRDRGTARQAVDQGYGIVCGADGIPMPDYIVDSTNQEHGIIVRRDGRPMDFGRFPIGSLLRILPNHACATATMHDRYHVVNRSDEVMDVWERVHGW
jgi:D-serine deaminase-like pyridoxal phosphate-dependent protein